MRMKLVAPGVPSGEVTRPGLSPFTASPEQLRGDPPSIADDVYGLGALAYELLSGYPPYYPRFEVRRVLEEPVPEIKPAQLMPAQLRALVMRMLSKRAALRPRSMREVIDELDATLNDTLTFDFEPVSVRMAKDQDLPLNPLRISGACGRLMCCLKYEHPLYQDFAERAPAVGEQVDTPDGGGTVVGHNVPGEKVVVRMSADGRHSACALASVCASRKAYEGSLRPEQ